MNVWTRCLCDRRLQTCSEAISNYLRTMIYDQRAFISVLFWTAIYYFAQKVFGTSNKSLRGLFTSFQRLGVNLKKRDISTTLRLTRYTLCYQACTKYWRNSVSIKQQGVLVRPKKVETAVQGCKVPLLTDDNPQPDDHTRRSTDAQLTTSKKKRGWAREKRRKT